MNKIKMVKVKTHKTKKANNKPVKVVVEVLVKNKPVPMEMVGVKDEFGEVGNLDYLAERFGLTERFIVEAVHKVLQRKR